MRDAYARKHPDHSSRVIVPLNIFHHKITYFSRVFNRTLLAHIPSPMSWEEKIENYQMKIIIQLGNGKLSYDCRN